VASRISRTVDGRLRSVETPSLIGIVGPTAAGKSDLGVGLALALGGEVVNADSMQLYRGMDVGTAKLSLTERRGVAHHLLDVLDVTQPATVAEFQALARPVLADCASRGRPAILVGGSGLYVRAIVDDLDFPGTDDDLRLSLEAELARAGAAAMHDRLAALDPDAAAAILPTNGRRIVRALEVIALTGEPFRARLPAPTDRDVVLIGLEVPPAELDVRIARRVDAMWGAGFVDEVRVLMARGLREGRTASRALGYQQVLAYLAGECTEEEARLATVAATRKFARRQVRWFRADPRVRWLPYDAPDLLDRALVVVSRRAS
jgi:tRNA dimethylallyltransferase